MTNIGLNMTEYTYKELIVLSNAVIREQVFGPQESDTLEMLKQWQVKIIEAMVQVKMRENVQSN